MVKEKRLREEEKRMERQNRKKNIIIKGLNEEKKMEEKDIKKYIEEALEIKVRIKKVSEIKTKGKKKWRIAELESWEQKKEVMVKKRNLEKGIVEDRNKKKM